MAKLLPGQKKGETLAQYRARGAKETGDAEFDRYGEEGEKESGLAIAGKAILKKLGAGAKAASKKAKENDAIRKVLDNVNGVASNPLGMAGGVAAKAFIDKTGFDKSGATGRSVGKAVYNSMNPANIKKTLKKAGDTIQRNATGPYKSGFDEGVKEGVEREYRENKLRQENPGTMIAKAKSKKRVA